MAKDLLYEHIYKDGKFTLKSYEIIDRNSKILTLKDGREILINEIGNLIVNNDSNMHMFFPSGDNSRFVKQVKEYIRQLFECETVQTYVDLTKIDKTSKARKLYDELCATEIHTFEEPTITCREMIYGKTKEPLICYQFIINPASFEFITTKHKIMDETNDEYVIQTNNARTPASKTIPKITLDELRKHRIMKGVMLYETYTVTKSLDNFKADIYKAIESDQEKINDFQKNLANLRNFNTALLNAIYKS